MRNRLSNLSRKVARTLKFSSCMGARRISNSNLGSEGSQCGKFSRFKEIFAEYKNDPYVSHVVRNVDGARRLFEIVLAKPYNPDNETGEEYIKRIEGFVEQAMGQRNQLLQDIAFLPPTEEYGQVKEELFYFVPFMFNYYVQKLKQLIPIGVFNNNTRLNFEGRSNSTASNISNLGRGSSNSNRSGSTISVGEWYPQGAANKIPNWKGGIRRTRRHRRR